jgi:hypothetical protein
VATLERRGQWIFAKLSLYPADSFVSRSLTEILELDLDYWSGGGISDFGKGQKDIGPELSLGVLIGSLYEPLGRAPQEDRGEAQHASRHGQNQSTKRNPKLVMKSEETIEVGKPSWAPIFTLLFVLLPIIGAMAGACRGRLCVWVGIGCYGL